MPWRTWVPESPTSERTLWARYRGLSLGSKILLYMVVGGGVGMAVGERATVVQPLGDLFIRLLVMAAVPLIFFNLLAGITSLVDLKTLGRLATKTFSFYVLTTLLALVFGLVSMHLLRPGLGMTLTQEADASVGTVPRVADVFLDLIGYLKSRLIDLELSL